MVSCLWGPGWSGYAGILSKFSAASGPVGSVGYYPTGALSSLTGYSATPYLRVQPCKIYEIGLTPSQVAFYDGFGNYISGVGNALSFRTPVNCRYVRFSCQTAKLNELKFQLKKDRVVELIVGPDTGVGSLRDVLEKVTFANEDCEVKIYLQEGTYDVFSYYSFEEVESTSFRGLPVPNYVTLIGVGNRENTIITGFLPEGHTSTTGARVSTINLLGNGDIENITVKAKNLRYAIHDDVPVSNVRRKVINCSVQYLAPHKDGYGWGTAYGAGCLTGSTMEFEDSEFITYITNTAPFGFHNNVNFIKPSQWKFKNCGFINYADHLSFSAGSMGSGVKDLIEFIGCYFTGDIMIKEQADGSGTGIDFEIKGYGNSKVPQRFVHADNGQYYAKFTDEVTMKLNKTTSIIPKGTPVKLTSMSGVTPMESGDAPTKFYGVALEDIEVDDLGAVRYTGYIALNELGTTANYGDKIGIVNGMYSVVTDNDYVGIVNAQGFLEII